MSDTFQLPNEMLDEIEAAPDFATATRPLLRQILLLVHEQLPAASAPVAVRRASLHLHPSAAYACAATEEWMSGGPVTAWTSGSLWKRVVSADEAILLAADTLTGASAETRVQLQRNGTTHVLVLPVRAALTASSDATATSAPTVVGMATVDFNSADTNTAPDVAALVPVLQQLIDSAIPFVADKPSRPQGQDPEADTAEWSGTVPVVGARTRRALRSVEAFARSKRPVLITGPSGAGKTFLAEALHNAHRAKHGGTFVVFSAQSYGGDLQLTELTGARAGATGMYNLKKDKPGLLEAARDGTLFVDDVDAMSRDAQANLLQLLDPRQRYRVWGDVEDRAIPNVRWVFATNAQLEGNAAFRQDLLYRINVLRVRLPGLDERRDEIHGWIDHFLQRTHAAYADAGSHGAVSIAADARRVLATADWSRGELRALEAVIYRAYLLASDRRPSADVHVTLAAVTAAMDSDDVHSAPAVLAAIREAARRLWSVVRSSPPPADGSPSDGDGLGSWIRDNNVLAAALWEAAEDEVEHAGGSASVQRQARADVAGRLGKEKSLKFGNYQKELRVDRQRLARLAEWLALRGQ